MTYSPITSGVPRAWWRSVGNSQNGAAVESFVDELAQAANQDPYQFRRRLLLQPSVSEDKPNPDERPVIATADRGAGSCGAEGQLGHEQSQNQDAARMH